jgi:hypothetical protein
MKPPSLNLDQANIALMLLSLALAFVLPFELVLMSYAFLGPAHYLTQISWLHDRRYFTGVTWLWLPLTLIVAAITVIHFFRLHTPEVPGVQFLLLSAAVATCVAAVVATRWQMRALGFILAFSLMLSLRGVYPPVAVALLTLLPSVIHIYIFTGIFVLLGALKNNSGWGLASFAVFVGCGAAFFFVTPLDIVIFPQYMVDSIGPFDDLSNYLADILSFGGHVNSASMMAFLSFAYTYHYLNWFSKTEVIKWHLIPKKRWVAIVCIYVISVGVYLFDYKTGFMLLMFLSVLHVVLELPLNILSFRMLGQGLRARLAGTV